MTIKASLFGRVAVWGLSAALLAFDGMALAAGDAPAAVITSERDSYINALKTRYGTGDERAALLAQSNQLLKDHALTASGWQSELTAERRADLYYRLSLGAPGELVVHEERREGADGAFSVRNQSLLLFGMNPFVRYDCLSGTVQSCVLYNPQDGKPLLSIERNPQGAEQLAKALGFLIRNLQKG